MSDLAALLARIEAAIRSLRLHLQKAPPDHIDKIIRDPTSSINSARLNLLNYMDRAQFGGKSEIEICRDELLAVLHICEPMITQKGDPDWVSVVEEAEEKRRGRHV